VFVNRQNHSDWSFTPLQYQQGIVTPNGVVYERHHNGTPDIDPDTHKLVIHGMVKQPLVFTMSDLMRYPSISKFYFMECSMDDQDRPSFKLSEPVVIVYNDENLQAKVEKVLGHIVWILEEAQKPVEASQSGVKRVKSLSNLAGKSN
jgi:hypothetical protein